MPVETDSGLKHYRRKTDVGETPPPPESIQVLTGVDVTRKLLTGSREMLAFELVALETHLG